MVTIFDEDGQSYKFARTVPLAAIAGALWPAYRLVWKGGRIVARLMMSTPTPRNT